MDFSNKSALREKYKKIRKNIGNKNEKSYVIFEKVINEDCYKNSKVIALYKNLEDEVNTEKMINHILESNKVLVLPKVENENSLIFYKVLDMDELVQNKFGILEPQNNEDNIIYPETIDLFLIPGICFDINKNRIGFGKGYYDYYLEKTNATKIGICFDEQISNEQIIYEKFDIKMDIIITDKRIIK